MARVDCSGAETGNTQEMDSVTLNVVTGGLLSSFTSDTAQARSGTRSWHSDLLNVGSILDTAFGTMTLRATTTAFSVCGSFWVDPNNGLAIGNPDVKILELDFGGATSIRLRFTWANGAATGTLNVYSTIAAGDAAAVLLTSFANVPTGAWNRVHIRGTVNTTPTVADTWAVRLNGIEQTGANQDYGTLALSAINLGMTGQVGLNIATSLDVFWDDIIVDNVNAANQIPDASFLDFFEPNADNTASWTTIGAGATHAARLTDDSDSTGLSSAADAQVENPANSDIAVGATFPTAFTLIVACYTSIRDGKVATLDVAGDIILAYQTSGGTTDTTTSATTVTNSTTAGLHRSALVRPLDPAGGAWSVADVNDVRIRMESDIGVGETVKVVGAWSYAEIQIKIDVIDPLTAAESVEIAAELSVADALAVSESTSIFVETDIAEALTIGESVSIYVEVAVQDALAESITFPILVIYVPQGGGSGTSIIIPEAWP